MLNFFKIILLIIILPIVVFLINYQINLNGYYNKSSRFLENIYLNQKKGNNIELRFSNYNRRKIVSSRIYSLKNSTIDSLVIGSSLTMKLGLPLKQKLLNFSVSSPSIQDYEIIQTLLEENNVKVNNLIINFYEVLCFENFKSDRHNLFSQLSLKNGLIEGFKVKTMLQSLTPNKIIIEKSHKTSYQTTLNHDGSIKDNFLNSSTNLKVNISKRLISLNNNINSYRIDFNRFNRLVKNTTANKVTIVIIPCPLKVYNKNKEFFNKIEREIIRTKIKSNINIIGSFNPLKFKIDINDFVDAHHLNLNGLNKIFN